MLPFICGAVLKETLKATYLLLLFCFVKGRLLRSCCVGLKLMSSNTTSFLNGKVEKVPMMNAENSRAESESWKIAAVTWRLQVAASEVINDKQRPNWSFDRVFETMFAWILCFTRADAQNELLRLWKLYF